MIYSQVPAYLNVVDIAGLVKGAHEGKGLGNAFLSNISACDGIFHVVSTCDFTRSKLGRFFKKAVLGQQIFCAVYLKYE